MMLFVGLVCIVNCEFVWCYRKEEGLMGSICVIFDSVEIIFCY